MDEPYVILIRSSKFGGHCSECQDFWQAGDACYWNPRTKETFCTDCGLGILEQEDDPEIVD